MPTELTRAKEVINELEFINRNLLADYFAERKFEAGIEYFKNGKKKSFWEFLQNDETIINELAKVYVFNKDKTADIFDDILKFYRENNNHNFKEIITKLDKKTNFTHTEKAFSF